MGKTSITHDMPLDDSWWDVVKERPESLGFKGDYASFRFQPGDLIVFHRDIGDETIMVRICYVMEMGYPKIAFGVERVIES